MKDNSSKIKALVKELIETNDYRILDKLKEIRKENAYRPRCLYPDLLELYKQGGLALHFHFLHREAGNQFVHGSNGDGAGYRRFDNVEYCAVVKLHREIEGKDGFSRNLEIQHGVFSDGGGECKHPVLVEVMEGVEPFECLIPSVVRLQTLDQCVRDGCDPSKSSFFVRDSFLKTSGLLVMGNMLLVLTLPPFTMINCVTRWSRADLRQNR